MFYQKTILSIIILILISNWGYSQVGLGHYSNKNNKAYIVSEFGLGASFVHTEEIYDNGYHQDPGFIPNNFNVYTNQGIMFNANHEWSYGFHGNLNLHFENTVVQSYLGLRTRISRHFGNDIEWNVSPGIRLGSIGEKMGGFDIESTVSWKDHVGIFTRYESQNTNQYSRLKSSNIYSIGIFTKGKKGLISTASSAAGVLTAFVVILSILRGRT